MLNTHKTMRVLNAMYRNVLLRCFALAIAGTVAMSGSVMAGTIEIATDGTLTGTYAGDTTNPEVYDLGQMQTDIAGKASTGDVTAIGQRITTLENAGYITNTVDDLTNYTKTTELGTLIDGTSALDSALEVKYATNTALADKADKAYSGTMVTGGSATELAGALSETTTQVNTNTGAITDLQEALGTTSDGTYVKNANDVGTNLGALDTQVAANTEALGTTSDGTYVKSTNDVGTNLGALDTQVTTNTGAIATNTANIGDVTKLSGVNAATAPADLSSAVAQLDTNMENVLGGVYNTDGTYKADALAGNGFETATSITDALSKYAENNVAATGTTFAADGSFTNEYTDVAVAYGQSANTTSLTAAISQVASNVGTAADIASTNAIVATNTVNANLSALDSAIGDRAYVNNAAVNYDAPASTATLTEAVSRVASNIGTAVTGTNGNVLATNTVNQNLDLIDTKIGNLADLKDGSVNPSEGNALTNGTGTQPTTVVSALNNIDATIGQVHGLRDKLENGGGTTATSAGSNLHDGSTVEDHLTELDKSIGNRTDIASKNEAINTATATSVAAGLKATGDAIGDMDFSSTRYLNGSTDTSEALRTLDSSIARIDSEVYRLKDEVRDGFASMAALTALVPNPRGCGDTQLSLGTGYYQGHTGVAIGAFHYINDHTMINFGGAVGGTKSATLRAGITLS